VAFPELRITDRRRRLAALATALVCIGCTAPAAQQSQVPSGTVAVTGSAHPSASSSPTPVPPTPSATSEPTGTPAASFGYEAPEGMLPPGSPQLTPLASGPTERLQGSHSPAARSGTREKRHSGTSATVSRAIPDHFLLEVPSSSVMRSPRLSHRPQWRGSGSARVEAWRSETSSPSEKASVVECVLGASAKCRKWVA
jgi:hypothetical protein